MRSLRTAPQVKALAGPSSRAGASPASTTPTVPIDRAAEDGEIGEIVERLGRRYAHDRVPSAVLEGKARLYYHEFDTARVRTYVPLFVERLVRSSIERPATGQESPQVAGPQAG